MSCFSLGKKLRPAKKAWKGFTSILLRKVHKIRRSKDAIKKTTRRLNDALAAALHRSPPSYPCRLIQRKIKKPLIARSTISPRKRRKHQTHKQKFAPVYVDELFAAEPISVQAKHLMTDEPTAATVGKLSEKQPQSSSSVTETSTVQRVITTVEMMKPFKTPPVLGETSKAATDTLHVIHKGGTGRSVVEVKEVSRLRGVDERAEEFITKFKEEIRLQNQRSLGEYQEMLARGL